MGGIERLEEMADVAVSWKRQLFTEGVRVEEKIWSIFLVRNRWV